jgi:nucleotide-binding universal stress UspA family protein
MGELYDRILLPTDGSAGMERVIEHAGDLARVHDATVHAVYVLDAASFSGLPMESSWEGVQQVLEDEGRTALSQVERLLADDVSVTTETIKGSPSREIVRYATDNDVDVIVMGTHGRGGIDRLLMGSVAENVVRRSRVPVLTVRVGEPEPPDAVETDGE